MTARFSLLRCSLLFAVAALFGALGCSVPTRPQYVTQTAEPMYVETTVSRDYHGRRVYERKGRWYFRESGQWAYYCQEPEPLFPEVVYLEERAPTRVRGRSCRPSPEPAPLHHIY